MLFDHVVQIVRHGNNRALLPEQKLKLLITGVRDVGHHATYSFLSSHGGIRKIPRRATTGGNHKPKPGRRSGKLGLWVRGSRDPRAVHVRPKTMAGYNPTCSGFDRENSPWRAAPPLGDCLLLQVQKIGEGNYPADSLDCELQSDITFRHATDGKALP